MINLNQLKDDLFDWVNDNTPIDNTVYYSNQNIPSNIKEKLHTTLTISSIRKIGNSVYIPASSPVQIGDKDKITNYNITLVINGFNEGCMESTTNLYDSLDKEEINLVLTENNIIFWDTTNIVNDISGLQGSENEKRCILELPFRYCSIENNVNVGQIDEVNVEGKLNTEGDNDIPEKNNITTNINIKSI